jgi:signal peptidase I
MKNRIPLWLKAMLTAALVVVLWDVCAFTSCTIPSTGMENALYEGERVWVSRWSYGWRVPFTTLRLGGGKAAKGDVVLFNNPNPQSLQTPVAWRELFISRCMGTPGDTLMLNADMMVCNEQVASPDSKALYSYPIEDEDTLQTLMDQLGIQENCLVGYADGRYIRSFSHYEYYLLRQRGLSSARLMPVKAQDKAEGHPIVVPQRGRAVTVYPWNVALLCNTILRHEGRQATVKGDTLLVEGRPVKHFVFTKDYYWMVANNPVNLCDSRLFGLVPADHLIGRAWRIWYPKERKRFLQEVQ